MLRALLVLSGGRDADLVVCSSTWLRHAMQDVERFMVLASRISSYETRLRCAQIMQTFDGNLDFAMGRLEIVQDAVREVRVNGWTRM